MLPKGHLSNGAKNITIKNNFRKAKIKNKITYEDLSELSGISEYRLKRIGNYGDASDKEKERIEELFNTKLH